MHIADDLKIKSMVIYQADNNLDRRDNLHELPKEPAIYSVCCRVNGVPANPRFIGQTENLQEAIRKHFSINEDQPTECFKIFMQSIKTKALVFQTVPETSLEERLKMKDEWINRFKPECNEVLNEVF